MKKLVAAIIGIFVGFLLSWCLWGTLAPSFQLKDPQGWTAFSLNTLMVFIAVLGYRIISGDKQGGAWALKKFRDAWIFVTILFLVFSAIRSGAAKKDDGLKTLSEAENLKLRQADRRLTR